MFHEDPIAAIRRYAGKLRTLRDEARTRRLIGALPRHIRMDIGWPDLFTEQRRRRS